MLLPPPAVLRHVAGLPRRSQQPLKPMDRAILSLSSLIRENQGETLILLDLCNVSILVVLDG